MALFKKYRTEKAYKDDKDTLSFYDYTINEPKASVIESGDYEFAVSRYKVDDFRFGFVNQYMYRLNKNNNYSVKNLKIQRPENNSTFLNCYIYLDKSDYGSFHRIGNKDNVLITTFYEVLEDFCLPAISEDLRVQFIIRDYSSILRANAINRVWSEVRSEVLRKYKEVKSLSFWGSYYIFFKSKEFNKVIEDNVYLEAIRNHCFSIVHAHDSDKCWTYDEFHILVDDYENYSLLGGQHYFNSDAMNNVINV